MQDAREHKIVLAKYVGIAWNIILYTGITTSILHYSKRQAYWHFVSTVLESLMTVLYPDIKCAYQQRQPSAFWFH